MASADIVVNAFIRLRDSLTTLAARTSLNPQKSILLHRAMIAGSLAEQCAARFGNGDVPGGDRAAAAADAASTAAGNVDAQEATAVDAVIAAADTACDALSAILSSVFSAARRVVREGASNFVGSLRVSPPVPRTGGPVGFGAPAVGGAAAQAQPTYAVSVAKLFPVEAATAFPLAQAYSEGSGFTLLLFIIVILVFIVALRYFGTLKDGKPAKYEIGIAVISFLLWIGSLKGYWIKEGGHPVDWITPDASAGLFGIATIMWVALVPYIAEATAEKEPDGQ
ncbi:hypothetical protein KRZ98_16330 [Sphingobium sp. AS12]|uniref:hypothetical protein n=1 Tax=Sphingobium sp. AS12 TaxID=2849495 RepID=UPI001C317E71|nr:hypothetical protein [Sphingobium sp. AS12]MBV2149814.1 hypothetical protein [Sphingobium sp. AS12]